MSLAELARRFESLAATVSMGSRTLLGLDTNPVPGEWTHITKVDPEAEKQLPVLYPLYLSHTSAVSVGGSQDVTDRNTEETFELLADASVPAFHEPSAAEHVTEQTRDLAAFTAIPEVLNGDSQALVGTLGEGLAYVREDLGPGIVEEKIGVSLDGLFGDRLGDLAAAWLMEESVFEAYIIMNTDSAAAREANVSEDDLLTAREAKQRAMAAEHHLESEIIYLEYSGTFGGDEAAELLEAIDDGVTWSRIWYGGGLDNREAVETVRDAGADAIVVGDVFHDIAELESELSAVARSTFAGEDVDRERLREWVEERIDVGDSSAARFLSTIPSVTDPTDRAAEYLAAGVETLLELEAIADRMTEPDLSEIRAVLEEDTLPGESELTGLMRNGATPVARRIAEGLLADRFDVTTDERFVDDHIAADLGPSGR